MKTLKHWNTDTLEPTEMPPLESASPLSPLLVQRIIREEEFPARCRSLPPETVAAVLRYGAPVGATIERHSLLHRGMERARELIRQTEEQGHSFPSGTAIVADELTGGKGRFRRSWHAPSGGVWLTLVLVNTMLPERVHLYPLAVGLACCEAVRHYCSQATVKWVNDVQVDGRKVAGVLTETERGPCYGEEYILIGLGVNCNNAAFPPELSGRAAALSSFTGAAVDLELFTARLLAKLSWNIGLLFWEEQALLAAAAPDFGCSPELLGRWRLHSDTVGRRVQFGYDVQQQPQFEAEVLGIDDQGGLHLRLPDGTATIERSGEILYLS